MSRLDPAAIDDLFGRIQHDIDSGVLPAAQVALAMNDEVVVERTFGDVDPETRFPLYSVTKALVAAAVWRLFGHGEIGPGQPVAEILPWFTGGGKEAIAVEHLLLHTAGIPRAPLGPPDWFSGDDRRNAMSDWYVATEPGTHFEYHGTSGFWVLGEVLAACGSADHRSEIHRLVTEPLGLQQMLGVDSADGPIEDLFAVASDGHVMEIAEITDAALLRFNTPEVRALGVPAAGGFAKAGDVAMLYQALLHNSADLWDSEVLRDGTSVIRVTQEDALRGCAANRTRGLVVAGDDGKATSRGFGSGCSAQAFGHDGVMGQAAWADPVSGLSMCFLTAALDADVVRVMKRSIGVSTRAAASVSAS
jgi:CubicO group peptidase (beta-lactamase class C family)